MFSSAGSFGFSEGDQVTSREFDHIECFFSISLPVTGLSVTKKTLI